MKVKSLFIFLMVMGVFNNTIEAASIFKSYRKLVDGIEIELEKNDAGAAGKVKLRIVSDKIIQVIATPEAHLNTNTSLMVMEGASYSGDWQV